MNNSFMTYMTNCAIARMFVVNQSLDLKRGPEYYSGGIQYGSVHLFWDYAIVMGRKWAIC